MPQCIEHCNKDVNFFHGLSKNSIVHTNLCRKTDRKNFVTCTRMIYIYGDSHAEFSFKQLELPHINYRQYSITMHRIGRDNCIINYNPDEVTCDDIVCLVYGEVDCRCHIQKQINNGRNEDEIIHELVHAYFRTIKNNIKHSKKIIVMAVIPPTRKLDCERIHGPITHEYPFVGSDEDRVRFTKKVNALYEMLCDSHGYIYFNPYEHYTRPDGTLNHELSDTNVHIGKNHTGRIINEFRNVLALIE